MSKPRGAWFLWRASVDGSAYCAGHSLRCACEPSLLDLGADYAGRRSVQPRLHSSCAHDPSALAYGGPCIHYVAYKKWLDPAAKALREAADLSDDKDFAQFLRMRADALLSDDYYPSDLKWLDLKSPKIDVIFAPYENVY